MDFIKATAGWPSWKQQAKKAVVAMAIIFAAGLLYVQLKKDYGLNDPIINTELQRDYPGSAWHDDPEMLKDYSFNARVYDSTNANDSQGAEFNADNATSRYINDADEHLSNISSNTGLEESIKNSSLPQKGMIKDGFESQSDNKTYNLGKQGMAFSNATTEGEKAPSKADFLQGDDQKTEETGEGGARSKGGDVAMSGGSLGSHQAMNASTGDQVVSSQHGGGGDHEARRGQGATNSSSELVASSLLKSSSIGFSNSTKNRTNAPSDYDKLAPALSPIPVVSTTTSSSSSTSDTNSFEQHNMTQGLVRGAQMDSRKDSGHNQAEPHTYKWKRKAPLWPYSRLELQLYAAKIAIQNAPLSNSSSNIVLHAPIYRNLSQFIRSYELMEKMFRVYIYKEGKKPLVHTGPNTGIYSSEGLFIRQMEKNRQFRTQSTEEALALFLPYSVANMVDELYEPPSTSMLPLSSFIKDYINEVAARHPFWNRTQGGDHFFVSCHDWGLMTTFEHAELRHNAIKVLCNADATTEFERVRDASLPEFYMHETKKLGDEGKVVQPAQPRDILAFFAGQMHGRVRPKLLEYWEYPKGGKEMQVYGVLPDADAHRMSYKERMGASRYCLCPMGYEVNSPRLVEAIHAMCVPVIIADGFVLPFSEVLDWASFSVTIAEKDLPFLKSILQAIPEQVYKTMQDRLWYVRRHFAWHDIPQPFDTFHMILHSVWTSRINNITSV